MNSASVVILSLLLFGCAGNYPNPYNYTSSSTKDASIEFSSDYKALSTFSVKTKPEGNRCFDYQFTGQTFYYDSVFAFRKYNPGFEIKIPGDIYAAVSGYYGFTSPTHTETCSPPPLKFKVEEGKKYFVKLNAINNACYLSIHTKENGKKIKIQSKVQSKCTKQ